MAETGDGSVGIFAAGELLRVTNCRFVVSLRNALFAHGSRRVLVTNCEFLLTLGSALAGPTPPGGLWELENCVQIGGATFGPEFSDAGERTVRARQCSLIDSGPLYYPIAAMPKDPKSGQAARTLRVEVSGTLLDSHPLTVAVWRPIAMGQSHTPPAVKPRDAWSRLVSWHGSDNVHQRLGKRTGEAMIVLEAGKQESLSDVHDLATWRKFWGSPETGSIEGEIRYQGGHLAGRLSQGEGDRITPDDFRLRPGSAGYRAGKDGKDLGADVDLVGPGPAYERWKKTPDYQEWLKESGQVKK
jgi:hypothetical protein